MSKSYDNIIIGSGITGLTIAKLLNNGNEDYLIIDKKKSVGGKLSTENHLGYELDCGFQNFTRRLSQN
jgi:Protoporphyrinogen oxidase